MPNVNTVLFIALIVSLLISIILICHQIDLIREIKYTKMLYNNLLKSLLDEEYFNLFETNKNRIIKHLAKKEIEKEESEIRKKLNEQIKKNAYEKMDYSEYNEFINRI